MSKYKVCSDSISISDNEKKILIDLCVDLLIRICDVLENGMKIVLMTIACNGKVANFNVSSEKVFINQMSLISDLFSFTISWF